MRNTSATSRSEPDTLEPLIADLVAFVAKHDRDYLEVMDAWRTSCPRLPVWEEANARGLVTRVRGPRGAMVRVTEAGRVFLARAESILRTPSS
jgi:D-3-phosphoglycerate dehydrogenase